MHNEISTTAGSGPYIVGASPITNSDLRLYGIWGVKFDFMTNIAI